MATNFVQRIEHSELVERIKKLHNYIYSNASDKDDKVEFANTKRGDGGFGHTGIK